jgi:hypothetical protein
MAEEEDFCEITLTAERRGKPPKRLEVHTFMGFPNRLETLMHNIKHILKNCIHEIELRTQLSLHAQLLEFFTSKLMDTCSCSKSTWFNFHF